MKRIAQMLCVALFLAGLPRVSWASGDKATKAEDAKYAELEKGSPGAAAFEGGDAAGTLLLILLIAGIAILIYLLLDNDHAHSMKSPLESPNPPAPKPAVFR